MQLAIRKKIKLNGVQILAIGFLVTILIGAIILSFPISSATGEATNFLDALFTSTSAVCVTGLVTLDTGIYWSVFGQTVIMILIEVGGLGFMSFATMLALLVGKRITLRERLVMQEAFNTFDLQGLVKMVKYIVCFTFSVQFFGALLLSTQFVPEYGIYKGIFYSIFHSISAFCNAGFDLFGNFSSLTRYSHDAVVIMVISALIIIGGLGFAVWIEIYNYKKGSNKLSIHSKLVILMTVLLLFGGFVLMFIFEYSNPATIGDMSIGDKLLNSWFASVTPRTAGFNSISTGDMTVAGQFLTVILMFIGGSPGSTAGGLKTATIGILLFTVISVIRGREDTELYKRRFSKELVYKAFVIFFLALILVISVTMILSFTEPHIAFEDLLYEATSAFATVGLSTGITPTLGSVSKVVLMITMYFGRVGIFTVMLAMLRGKKKQAYKYPEGKILIG